MRADHDGIENTLLSKGSRPVDEPGAAPRLKPAQSIAIWAIMIPFSVLDLSPIVEGSDAGQALRNSLKLAQHVERLGYTRFWLAEHHNMPGTASAATSVVMAHVAGGTSTIRVGSGGIMLPNHAPLVIAEQFGTLEALFPGRIDLGLGRAPGSDQLTARALRRTLAGDVDRFPNDVVELMQWFEPTQPGQAVQAVPGAGLQVPIYILGSSLFGAELAAVLGLPYAFASHFAPADMMGAIALYRSRFQPSERLESPHVMLGFNVFGAETDAKAQLLSSSVKRAVLNMRTGRPRRLGPPEPDFDQTIGPAERAMLEQFLTCSAIGSPQTVRAEIGAFIDRTGADELILTSQIYDFDARLRSFEIAAEVRDRLVTSSLRQTEIANA